jgi:hypothetical protein
MELSGAQKSLAKAERRDFRCGVFKAAKVEGHILRTPVLMSEK